MKGENLTVGITGQGGFVGWHFTQYLSLIDEVRIVPFQRSYFDDDAKMKDYVSQCDIIVHLAAKNRDPDPQVIYDTNVSLVEKLLSACGDKPVSIYFSSSIQEGNDNLYGRSKKECWRLIEKWGKETGSTVGSFVVPNVFGPFGKPNYNSFVASFCHMIANGESPTIMNDGTVDLIHVHDLVKIMWRYIQDKEIGRIEIPAHYKKKVSEVYDLLDSFRSNYLEQGLFPDLEDKFELQLYNMFRTYIPDGHYPVSFTEHTDNRGSFVEIARTSSSGQFSYSTTVPGITRGNHFHTRKAERFAVIKGKARIQVRKIGTDEIVNYFLDGEEPSYVDMPIWHTHNITNIGEDELITLFWINESYNPEDPDTYFINV